MENLSNSEENKYTAKIFSYDNSDSPVSFDDERIILFYRFLNPKIDRFRLPKAHLIPLKQFVHDTLKYSIIIAIVLFLCNFRLDLNFGQWIMVLGASISAIVLSQLYGLILYMRHKDECDQYLKWRQYLKRKGITRDYQVKAALDFEDTDGTLNDYITNYVQKHQIRSYCLFVIVMLSLSIFAQSTFVRYIASDSTRDQNIGYFTKNKTLGTVTSSEYSFGDYKININYINSEGITKDTYYRTDSNLKVGDVVDLAYVEHGNAARPVLITSIPKYTLFWGLADILCVIFSFIIFIKNYWHKN
jgi:hypothetical protein